MIFTSSMAARSAIHRRADGRTLLASLAVVVISLVGSGLVLDARAAEPEFAYDVVIRNGRVLDGAGNPWVRADVAIRDGRFVKIGSVSGRGRQEIDAAGDYVSPGWIDMMDQSGEVLLVHGLAENKVRMGVTTAIGGEGGTPVPAAKLAEYFTELERGGISINFGTYYSATQARVEVMGDVAGTPTPTQMQAMKARVEQAMQSGALGITTALMYPPSSFQSTGELIELAKVAARYDGIYASHIRDESADLVKSLEEAIEIGERGGVPVEIFHLKAAYAPGWGKLMIEAGRVIEAARARGVSVAADVYPYTAAGTGLDATVPRWVFEQGGAKAIEKLKDPAVRTRLKAEITAGRSSFMRAVGGWQNVVLANPQNPAYDRFRGQSMEEIARQLRKDPADAAWDILIEGQPDRAYALYFVMDERDIEMALRFPWVSIGSDAEAAAPPGQADALSLPHPRSYGTFPRIIAEYVRKRGVLSLPDAVRKMTSWPAARMRLEDRGLIREGLRADVTVFNYERIEDKATWAEPSAYPVGIDYVLVNGQLVVERGRHTGAKPGRVLKGNGQAAATVIGQHGATP